MDVIFKVHDFLTTSPRISLARVSQASEFIYYAKSKRITLFEEVPILQFIQYEQKVWEQTFETIIDKGGEGIIIKRSSSLYQAGKRNSDLLKLKLEATFDLLCKEVYYTVGEKGNSNMNLTLVRKNGVEVPVRVGKHSDIAKFEAESPVGGVIAVRCMKELEDGSLREPRFKCPRPDKLVTEID
jgi:ATP-dependent DNA ligase